MYGISVMEKALCVACIKRVYVPSFFRIIQVHLNKPGQEGATAKYEVGVEGHSSFPVNLVPFEYLFLAS